MITILLRILWIMPINKKRMVFRSAQGESYNCNPKYICEYILKECPEQFELVWIFKNPEHYAYLRDRGVIVIKDKSIKSILYLITAHFIIDNHGIQSYLPVRKGQVIINTWHGGGSYKKVYINHNKKHTAYVKKMYRDTTAFVSSCKKFSDCNLARLRSEYPDKTILECGSPRNDIFFNPNPEVKDKVKKVLGISKNQKILLYAPTFRDDVTDENYNFDIEPLLEACKKRFGGDFVFVVRYHRFSHTVMMGDNQQIVNANRYDDMQELIYASDVVITDYSSLIWDVSLLFRPCFIYALDLPEYMRNRDFYTPIAEWPFPLAESFEKLCDNIQSFDEFDYRKRIVKHHEDMGSFENGTAAQQIVEYMVSKL